MDPPRREIGGAILYLDFDGVLHPEPVYQSRGRGADLGADADGHKLSEHGALLDSLLDPYPDIRIVLSTSCVRQYRFAGAARRLPEGLRRRCIGATFHTRMDERVFECMDRRTILWIHGHTHAAFDYGLGGCWIVSNPRGYRMRDGTFENDRFGTGLVVAVEDGSES